MLPGPCRLRWQSSAHNSSDLPEAEYRKVNSIILCIFSYEVILTWWIHIRKRSFILFMFSKKNYGFALLNIHPFFSILDVLQYLWYTGKKSIELKKITPLMHVHTVLLLMPVERLSFIVSWCISSVWMYVMSFFLLTHQLYCSVIGLNTTVLCLEN
jgi:hypothetical protein